MADRLFEPFSIHSDDDVLHFVLNIYKVLLTRGIRGTFGYVCDPELREFLRGKFLNTNSPLKAK